MHCAASRRSFSPQAALCTKASVVAQKLQVSSEREYLELGDAAEQSGVESASEDRLRGHIMPSPRRFSASKLVTPACGCGESPGRFGPVEAGVEDVGRGRQRVISALLSAHYAF